VESTTIRFQKTFHPLRFVRSIYRRLRKPVPLYVEIGRFRVRLPINNQLLHYKSSFHLYDTALGKIAAVLKGKYPDLHAIDIGANVGDTAALICESSEIPVLCIEGDPLVLPFLRENAARLGAGITIEESFVGPDGKSVDLNSAHDLGRNACLVQATDSQSSIGLHSLQSILDSHPAFLSSKLLKSDTEGFDFSILQSSLDFLGQAKPVLFFEYDPHLRPSEPKAGLETIDALIGVGYSDFIFYDNYGNFLLHTEASNRTFFSDLDSYLASNWRHGVAVYYFDVCALHHEDADLVPQFRSLTQR